MSNGIVRCDGCGKMVSETVARALGEGTWCDDCLRLPDDEEADES